MNKKYISTKYLDCCIRESKHNKIIQDYLNSYYDLCYLLSNNMIDKQNFDLFIFLEQISNNFKSYSNIKLLFFLLRKNIQKIVHFKHFIDYISDLIKKFNGGTRSNKSLFTLEQIKVQHKLYVILENLMYFIKQCFPNYCEFAKNQLYNSFDEEVESIILNTVAHSLQIEIIEDTQKERKRKYIDVNDDISTNTDAKKKYS